MHKTSRTPYSSSSPMTAATSPGSTSRWTAGRSTSRPGSRRSPPSASARSSGRWITLTRRSRASVAATSPRVGAPVAPTTVMVLTDFGSTYTKVTLVDVASGRLVARAQAPTTVARDVMDGFQRALADALDVAGPHVTLGPRAAASSAGGGLRIAAIGLVSELTAEAARRTALNAGGRIELTLSGDLGRSDAEALLASRPDVILFSGGTDGGQRDRV